MLESTGHSRLSSNTDFALAQERPDHRLSKQEAAKAIRQPIAAKSGKACFCSLTHSRLLDFSLTAGQEAAKAIRQPIAAAGIYLSMADDSMLAEATRPLSFALFLEKMKEPAAQDLVRTIKECDL